MDARAALRRYLEQRRELGETELVLDRLTVEEAMSLLGAVPGAAPGAVSHPGARRPRGAESPARPDPPPDESPLSDSGDWRAALRESERAERARDAAREPVAPPAAPPSRDTHTSDHGGQPSPTAGALGTAAGGAPGIAGVPAPPGLSAEPPADLVARATIGELHSLEELASAVHACTRCKLYATATHGVPGEGNPRAELVVVGEAPGVNEDVSGRPFVGQAGQLLTKILAAIDLAREDVFICNVLKHRPPGNRNPQPEEIVACSPYLVRQLEIVRPKVILALGTFAAQTLLDSKQPIGKLRGSIHRYHGIPLVVTYHPAALLRNPSWKRPTWEDVQLARRILDRATGAA